ncbi:hypothetical protein [Bradyrhizobium iriomotense]|uniref:hypothetical protein n=1 Tax=Bradyrhizobium iriomotense TaxID=441950 RepID=UPI001B89FD27|nr:hypothetical protein [Bradyrhizobium iriomotense]MBR0781066.1 hypothetical protein [Bradyrhizobium iriomotense]
MGNATRRASLAIGWAAATLCLPTLAHAGGRLPISPVTKSFKSHRACVASLEATYAEDRRQIVPRAIDANGNTRETNLLTKGIERLGPKTARYDATIWYHNGGLRADLPGQQLETSHSYRHRIRQCEGRVMTTSGGDGYTLSTFDAADTPDRPKQ